MLSIKRGALAVENGIDLFCVFSMGLCLERLARLWVVLVCGNCPPRLNNTYESISIILIFISTSKLELDRVRKAEEGIWSGGWLNGGERR